MLKIIKADGAAEKKQIEDMRARAAQTGEGISAVAAAVLQDVRENGYAAVEKYSLQFDGAKPREITAEELDAAYESCPKELIAAMEQAAADIRDYNEKLLVRSAEWRNPAGGIVGRVVRGLTRVGIYVPGGTAAYPSSVLMNAVPAKVAGVEEIIITGMMTHNCVIFTSLSKSAEKYQVKIIPECTTTIDPMVHNFALAGLSIRVPFVSIDEAFS